MHACFDYRSDRTVYVAKWNNNSIVHIASNYMYNTHLPVHNCKRRVNGATLDVTWSHLIAQCGKGMGVVHLLDLFLFLYRPTICVKKWYWPLFAKHVEHYRSSSLEISLRHKQYEAVSSGIHGTHHNDPYTK